MTLPTPSADRVLAIYLALNQYPILAGRIRARMRRDLFERGIITLEKFESEARQKSIESQTREGLSDPYAEESNEIWEIRLARVRDSLTDFYFAYNFPYESFEQIAREIIGERGAPPDMVTFNPELAPQDMLFEQAEMIERLPREDRHSLEARLQEIKVVLIRTMISDQLAYLNIARKWFTVEDLREIRTSQDRVWQDRRQVGRDDAGLPHPERGRAAGGSQSHSNSSVVFSGFRSFLHLHGGQRAGALGGPEI